MKKTVKKGANINVKKGSGSKTSRMQKKQDPCGCGGKCNCAPMSPSKVGLGDGCSCC